MNKIIKPHNATSQAIAHLVLFAVVVTAIYGLSSTDSLLHAILCIVAISLVLFTALCVDIDNAVVERSLDADD